MPGTGTWTNVYQERIDSENYNSGSSTGNYSTAQKLSLQLNNNTASNTSIADFMAVNIANIQSYFFMVDTGNVSTPVTIHFVTTSGNVTANLTANVPLAWDSIQVATVANNAAETANTVQAGVFSGFNNAGSYNTYGAQITAMNYNLPAVLGNNVNFTGRIATT
jgi:hypothetical protein